MAETKDEVANVWYSYLMGVGDMGTEARYRKFYRMLPKDPRCRLCHAPFAGVGGWFVRSAFNKQPSRLNPNYCNVCEDFGDQYQGGAEVPCTMLFADVRGSVTMAEEMGVREYGDFINRFYTAATKALVEHDALIEKMIGDEVTAMFVPGWAGKGHSTQALQAALKVMEVTGHGMGETPWVSVGIGLHTGMAYIGMVGEKSGVKDIVALGDDVNIAARLASLAKEGEIVISDAAFNQARFGEIRQDLTLHELRLKGRKSPVHARVVTL